MIYIWKHLLASDLRQMASALHAHMLVCETSRQNCDVSTHYQYVLVCNSLLGSSCMDKRRIGGHLLAVIFACLVVSLEKLRHGLLVGTSCLT